MIAEQVGALSRQRGITFTRWAEENGCNRDEAYRVFSGQTKARYDKSHEIAVKLELKSATQAT